MHGLSIAKLCDSTVIVTKTYNCLSKVCCCYSSITLQLSQCLANESLKMLGNIFEKSCKHYIYIYRKILIHIHGNNYEN